VPDEPAPDDAAGLRAERDADQEMIRRLGLRPAELERRLGTDSTDSGTPSSKERIGAKEARRARQQSERERSKDRKRGGQPGHQGKGLKRDPGPGEEKDAPPPVECRSCRAPLDGAEDAGSRWAQVIDVALARKVTEWALPGLSCPCCGTVTLAEPPPGAHQDSVSYGPALNAAAVLPSCYGNLPSQRSAQVIGMLFGVGVSAGWAGKATARVNARLGEAGLDAAMLAALAAEDVLAADETPVSAGQDRSRPGAGGEGRGGPGGKGRKDLGRGAARAGWASHLRPWEAITAGSVANSGMAINPRGGAAPGHPCAGTPVSRVPFRRPCLR
jgi:hypothetical protein